MISPIGDIKAKLSNVLELLEAKKLPNMAVNLYGVPFYFLFPIYGYQ